MKSVVELEIGAPRERVATLFADPLLNPQWMDDLERVEPIGGELGTPGSTYRLSPKKGTRVFVATVIAREHPTELFLKLEASDVTVFVRGTLTAVSADRTRLVSEEVFRFKGPLRKVAGLVARGAIRKAHRRHIEAFRHLVERRR